MSALSVSPKNVLYGNFVIYQSDILYRKCILFAVFVHVSEKVLFTVFDTKAFLEVDPQLIKLVGNLFVRTTILH